jgi:hypothetical protein
MEQLTKLIQIDHNFRKSVNLELDLGDEQRVGSYIPTRSSVIILRKYIETIVGKNTDTSTILIGPYGKGKSHLLLVLLSLLNGSLPQKVWNKITAIDPEIKNLAKRMNEGQEKYLPVLVSAMPGNDLNQAFVQALSVALQREKLDDVAPETYYSQALLAIEKWKASYPAVYEQLEELTAAQGWHDIEHLKQSLEKQDRNALKMFTENYPLLTAGSIFAPLVQTDALKVYQQVNRILTEEYGYRGMFLVFDEFSKYVEGHPVEGFAANMKTLQDMCELSNNPSAHIYITLVAHKSIHEYSKSIDSSVKNAFRGVEGRITEITFVVSAQNNYELIADTIGKKEPEFSKQYKRLCENEAYREIIEKSYEFPGFSQLFKPEEYWETVARGCFPLTPLGAYVLLHISEKVAQNERTIFTFLADEGQGSLSWILARENKKLIGVDKIYDYFKSLFRETEDAPLIHAEWLKAEYALSRAEQQEEMQIIKAVALFGMIHREDELPARDMELRLALGMDSTVYQHAIEHLKEQDILVYRQSQAVYAFRNNVGLDVEKAISAKMQEIKNNHSLCKVLTTISEMDYELPKQYNQKYAMTRYFQYVYMEPEEFLGIAKAEYLFEEKFADGKIIVLITDKKIDENVVQEHLNQLSDPRLVVLVSEKPLHQRELILKYEAVMMLEQDAGFIEENKVLLQELILCENDIAFEINARLEENFLPENENVFVLQPKAKAVKCKTANSFNSILSEICEAYYRYSPKVNHELINIEEVGSQYSKARDGVIKTILEDRDVEHYMTGTMPEAMVYRAVFVHTSDDMGCQKICEEIDRFFETCAGKRQLFRNLYQRLQGREYGTRKGIIPLFIARKLAEAEGTAVIYLGNSEYGVSADILKRINEHPDKYELYIEPESAEKEKYLKALEEIFCERGTAVLSKQSRLVGITQCMQKWYRSLPQYAMVSMNFLPDEAGKISALRNLVRRADVNPREMIFERLPECFGTENYATIAAGVKVAKKRLDDKLNQLLDEIAVMIKEQFYADKTDNLKACLKEWYGKQNQSVKKHILSTTANSFLNYLDEMATNDEHDIATRLSRIILDVYVEDWTDETLAAFQNKLLQTKQEIEHIASMDTVDSTGNRLILRDAEGHEYEKCFEADISDSTSMYLKNMIDEALEEFGDTLEMNQKVAVLVQAIEGLLH